MESLFNSGIRPIVDAFIVKRMQENRDYGLYWSASSAGYCMKKLIFERLGVPPIKEDARKYRVFESGKIFHDWIQELTRDAGVSIAQEVELQDEDLMVRGHFDDLVLINDNLLLIDYKTQNSRAFSWQQKNGGAMSYFHRLQLGTYLYMLQPQGKKTYTLESGQELPLGVQEARILKISKDDLRMSEQQLFWSEELQGDVLAFWNELNHWWNTKKLPPCSCADHEGGFMAKEAYNPYFYGGEPCSVAWLELCKAEDKLTKKEQTDATR